MPLPLRLALCRLFSSRRLIFALIAVASLALVAAAIIIGEIERVFPCSLCAFQRLFFLLIAFFALLGLFWPRPRARWGVLIALSAAGGTATAIYQTIMQVAPGAVAQCGSGDPNLVERIVDWLGTQWPFMFLAPGVCSDPAWIFLGLSMATWSALCFVAFFIAAGALIYCGRRT